jgi:hypothetical protein
VWWLYIIVAVVLLFGIYAFLVFAGLETRILSRRTSRTAESMYPIYADPLRRHARQQDGDGATGEGTHSREPKDIKP